MSTPPFPPVPPPPSEPAISTSASSAELAQLAAARPELWDEIRKHPNCYADLDSWIIEMKSAQFSPQAPKIATSDTQATPTEPQPRSEASYAGTRSSEPTTPKGAPHRQTAREGYGMPKSHFGFVAGNSPGDRPSGITFAPGETEVESVQVVPDLLHYRLRTDLAATDSRIVCRHPNTIFFGLIPLGYQEQSIPLANTAPVGANVRIRIGYAIIAVLIFIGSIAAFDSSPVGGLMLLAIFAVFAASAVQMSLEIQNTGGTVQRVGVSYLEKAKLQKFQQDLQNRLFAYHSK